MWRGRHAHVGLRRGRILEVARVAETAPAPIENLRFVINRRVAQARGLALPQASLARADEMWR